MVAVPVAPTWDYDHAPRGTCVKGCRDYGVCHCGCGGVPSKSIQKHNVGQNAPAEKGEPRIFVRGHNPYRGSPGCWQRTGVPLERIRPLILWAQEQYGIPGAAKRMGIPWATLNMARYSRTKQTVTPQTARIIVEFVLAHRRRTSMEPWATFDTDRPRPATQYERELSRRGAAASHKQFERQKQSLRRQWQKEGRPADEIREVVGAMQAPVSSLAYREW